jgi:hypothetical protein
MTKAESQRGFTAATFLLVVIAMLVAAQTFMQVDEYLRRRTTMEQAQNVIAELEKQRVAVFDEYLKDLRSPDTKSVYHQIYHVSNAQLKMANIVVQENQVVTTLLAGKR